MRAGIDAQLALCDHLLRRNAGAPPALQLDPAERCPGSRQQLPHAERLDEVVVGADFEPEDAIDLFATCRQHDDRHQVALAKLPADG